VTSAWIGIGANLGDPRAQVLHAIDELGRLPLTRLAARSSLYRTAAIDAAGQPDYVNAVAHLDSGLEAAALLAALQAIEDKTGRERPFRNAPRTLDLDLLLYGDERIETPTLRVPHPRMHERAFVLAPLLEIEPEARIPGLGPAREWIARCAGQEVERIA